jgi:hypothetical protein
MSVRSDVGPMIDTWQSHAPQAYQSTGVLPDEGHLAEWMRKMLETSGGLKLTRSADPFDRALRYLELEGVDIEGELAKLGRRREAEVHRSREAADRCEGLAIAEKKARARLAFEQAGLRDGASGFSVAKVREAAEHVSQLERELEEACQHDRRLVRQARRAAG